MVRRLKRPRRDERLPGGKQSADAVYLGGLVRFIERHVRQYRREPFCLPVHFMQAPGVWRKATHGACISIFVFSAYIGVR